MAAILSQKWNFLSSGGMCPITIQGTHQPLVDILRSSIGEEIEHVLRRKEGIAEDTQSYDKSYTRTYTQYTRENPMYDMSDYTAGLKM